jgi:diguanylate cyclase (GGDEF)-like protein/PAS domain S-box-containing protein
MEWDLSGMSIALVLSLLGCFILAFLALYWFRRHRALATNMAGMRSELLGSEARYRMLAENATDVIWTVRLPDLRFTYISPSVTRLRGLSVADALAETFPESVVPEQQERVLRIIEQRVAAFKAGSFDPAAAERIEVRQPRADGGVCTVEIIATLLTSSDGEVVGIQGISRDVSKRKSRDQARLSREAVLGALARGARRLFNASDKNRAMEQTLADLGRAVCVDRVYVFENHCEPDTDRLAASMRYEWVNDGITPQIDNPDMHGMPYESAIPNWLDALQRGEPVHGLVADMAEQERTLLQAQGIISIVVMPIFQGGEFWGMIGFDDCTRQHQWNRLEIDALEVAAGTVGAAIRGIRAEQELKRQVSTDSLTGLLSRRAFLKSARQAYAEAHASDGSVALLILDLDHFKVVNDTHGHPVGDQALKAFASVCQLALRDDDLIGRMGGEEFAVLLREIDARHAGLVAEKLRAEVEVAQVELHGIPLQLTVSIGLALSGQGEGGFGGLLKLADQALYRAKRAGRNRVEEIGPG